MVTSTYYFVGIIVTVVIAAVAIFASIPTDTWKDKRTEFTGVAPPDENNQKIDCLSKGGIWDGTSCNYEEIPEFVDDSFEESFEEIDQSKELVIPLSAFTLNKCSGDAQCIPGGVTQIIDGDTIKVEEQSVRFALASAPELNESGGEEARKFIQTLCPVGAVALVDEDDGQIEGSYGRIVGVVFCNGLNLNEELLDAGMGYLSSEFCDVSEFAEHTWAQKHGCITMQN